MRAAVTSPAPNGGSGTMIGAIALLLACQLAGEAIQRVSGLPLPGPVIGMGLLLGWLALWPKERPTLDQVTAWLTAHLSVLFVAAAVGLMQEGPILSRHGLAIAAATVVSTVLTIMVTAWTFRLVASRLGEDDIDEGGEAEA